MAQGAPSQGRSRTGTPSCRLNEKESERQYVIARSQEHKGRHHKGASHTEAPSCRLQANAFRVIFSAPCGCATYGRIDRQLPILGSLLDRF